MVCILKVVFIIIHVLCIHSFLALIDFNGAKIDVRWTRSSKIHLAGCQALLRVTDHYEHLYITTQLYVVYLVTDSVYM